MTGKDNKVETYRTPEYTEKYANQVYVRGGFLDVAIRFGISIRPEPAEDNGQMVVEYFQGILMSPQEAKILAGMLSEEVRRYEECFGPLPAPRAPAPADASERAATPNADVVQ
jgi:hypothetical protein